MNGCIFRPFFGAYTEGSEHWAFFKKCPMLFLNTIKTVEILIDTWNGIISEK